MIKVESLEVEPQNSHMSQISPRWLFIYAGIWRPPINSAAECVGAWTLESDKPWFKPQFSHLSNDGNHPCLLTVVGIKQDDAWDDAGEGRRNIQSLSALSSWEDALCCCSAPGWTETRGHGAIHRGKEKIWRGRRKGRLKRVGQKRLEAGDRWRRERDWDGVDLWEETQVKKIFRHFFQCYILKFFLRNFYIFQIT